LINQSQSQKNISNHFNKDFEIEFTKLWVKLESVYVKLKFTLTMGGVNSTTAKEWRMEFKNSGIGEKEINYIRKHLDELERPEFIPNSLTVAQIYKKKSKECRPILGQVVDLKSLSSIDQIQTKRKNTKSSRDEAFNLIRELVGTDQLKTELKLEPAYQPTERMKKLIIQHNRMMISMNLQPLDFGKHWIALAPK